MSTVKDLIKDIELNLSQKSASQKDEVRVMKEMLNDPTYKVGEYTKDGKVGEYCPREDAEKIAASILSNGAKLPGPEAKSIASGYNFTATEANAMVNISKEFINTYIRCGRKLPIGGREDMNVALLFKKVEAQDKKLPSNMLGGKVDKTNVKIPAHATIKAQGGCPKWIRG